MTITCFVWLSHARLRAEIKVWFIHLLLCSPSTSLFISADMEKSSEGAFAVWSFQTTDGRHKDLFSLGVSAVGELLCSQAQESRNTHVWVVSPALSEGRLCWLLWGVEGAVSHSSLDVLRGAWYLFCLGTCLGCCSSVAGTLRSWMKPPQHLSWGRGFSFSSQHDN